MTSETEAETKEKRNSLRLPPKAASVALFPAHNAQPFVLKGTFLVTEELRSAAKPDFTNFCLWTPVIQQSKGTVSGFLKSTKGPGKAGRQVLWKNLNIRLLKCQF